jgi:hypothetical protein
VEWIEKIPSSPKFEEGLDPEGPGLCGGDQFNLGQRKPRIVTKKYTGSTHIRALPVLILHPNQKVRKRLIATIASSNQIFLKFFFIFKVLFLQFRIVILIIL